MSEGGILWMKFHTQCQLTISKKFMILWLWIEELWFGIKELHVIFLKEVSFEWKFILISTKNKQKIGKFILGIEVLCVIFLKEVSSEWKFILISAKNEHKIEKFLFGKEVLCVIFLNVESFEWKFILISAKKSTKLRKFDLEWKCYVSYLSRRYLLNEISY